MEFFSLNQKDLLTKLSICNQVSLKKSEVEIFTYTRVDIKNGELALSALNPSLFFKTKLKIQNIDKPEIELSFLIKTDVFSSSIALITDEKVSLEIDLEKSTLVIQGAKSKHTLRINNQMLADFVLPSEKPEELQATARLITQEALDAIKSAQISVGQPKNVYQPEFLNICFTLKPSENKMLIVSTDRYRITKNVLVANYDNLNEFIQTESSVNFLINPKSVQLLTSAVESEDSIEFNFEKDFLWIKFDNTSLIMRYGEGKYPDYDKIIPQSFNCTFSISSKDLLNSLKQVYLFARTNTINHSVTLKADPKNSRIVLSAQTQDGYSSESSVDIENYEGVQEEWTQAFNADYLIDYISTVNTAKILWEANPGKPSVLSPDSQKEKQLYLVSGLK